jgi:hypothetical protein
LTLLLVCERIARLQTGAAKVATRDVERELTRLLCRWRDGKGRK